ncbi:hypothetical protein EMA8858_00352 [Emticicia aquatica]|uniref:Outer membrane protein beta-barrel domain-containing protein n=1 Tax=Emticicia aquatica TaxID=1681835 RepID=A0ABN8EN58_9BACT|nr:hypothetical protein [Emticicia aquatica]CAH0994243.1 hypothetical protein EMA8858_00352 [Emticicia aquatica]
MQKTPHTLILFLFISTFCNAQSNFVKGVLINNQKDTLSGYIDYREWIKSPSEISFKKETNQASSIYNVNDLRGFVIDYNKETYEALSFEFEKLPRHLTKHQFSSLGIYANRKKEIVDKKKFVRLISKGRINLYQFVDSDLDIQFLVKETDKIVPLVYHIIRIDNEIAKLREYQIQLTNLLSDACKKLPIEKTEYSLNEMKDLVDNYNTCFTKNVKLQITPKDKGKFEYGLLGGVSYSTLNYIYPSPYTNSVIILKGKGNLMPIGGIYLNYVLARGRGKIAVVNEFITYSIKSTVKGIDYSHFNIRYLGLQNLIRYKVYLGNPSIYLLLGLSNGLLINNNSFVEISSTGSTRADSREFRKHEEGIVGGIGTSFNKLMIESRYTRGNGFAVEQYTNTPTNRLEIVIKYNLGK